MYYFHFTHYAWQDRVFLSDQQFGNPWDLLHLAGEYLLVLGDDVARQEQHTKIIKPSSQPEVISSALLWLNSLTMIRWMVEHRFTTYKNVVPLWIGDIDELLKVWGISMSKSKKWTTKPFYHLLTTDGWALVQEEGKKSWQQLVVFPDVWTMTSYLQSLDEKSMKEILTLHGQSTAKQKSQAFRALKTGKASTLCCTYSQLFQDWHSLKHILLVDQHKRYYKSQQDPRYYVPTVVEELAKVWGIKLEKTWLALQ